MAFKRKVTEEMRQAMQAEFDLGASHSTIAKRYGVRPETVANVVEIRYTESAILDKPYKGAPKGFEEQWDEARGRILGYRIGWAKEWNEARERLLKGARA